MTQKTQPHSCREGVFTGPLHSNGIYSIVACVFVAAVMCLSSSCLAMDVFSDFTIPAFGRHVTIWLSLFPFDATTYRHKHCRHMAHVFVVVIDGPSPQIQTGCLRYTNLGWFPVMRRNKNFRLIHLCLNPCLLLSSLSLTHTNILPIRSHLPEI
jgi:hypothetical protein